MIERKPNKNSLLPAKLNHTTPVSHVYCSPPHPEIGVKFRDGEKEFKALVISPSALSALSRKEGSAQWELFGASQLTWLVQHTALMNDTLSWKWRKKTYFLLEIQTAPKARTAAPIGAGSPISSPWGAAFGVAGPGSPGGPSRERVPLLHSQPGTWWDFLQRLTLPALCRARPGGCLQVRGRAAEGANPPGKAALFKCVVVWNLFHTWQINER